MTTEAEHALSAGPISAYEPRDWHDVPRGFYAIPVFDWSKFGDDCMPDAPMPDLDLVGYKLFARKTPRVFKNGKTVGKDRFVIGKQIIAQEAAQYVVPYTIDGVELKYTPWERLTEELSSDRFVAEHTSRAPGSTEPLCRCGECTSRNSDWIRVPDWEDAYANAAAGAILDGIEDRGDPFRKLYGQLTGQCGICGKLLSDPESKLRGIGPDCFAHFREWKAAQASNL
jgi:hypothetical protein